jgi:hypothetical protein
MASRGSGFNLDLLTLVINATADPVVEALGDASDAVENFVSNFVGIGIPVAAAFAGVEATISGVKAVIEGITSSVIGFNDSMFDYSVQLKKVMDDNIETAQGRLLEIQDIARGVDFGVENLAMAARTLRDLGGSALDTDENLKLFADTAAATGNKVETVATVMGRLYGVVQEGQPIGRLSLQLQRMGIVSAETIAHVQNMQKAGADANTVWNEITNSLQKFVPAAEESVGSVESFSAMIQKNLNIWNANAFKPLYDGFRDLFHVISDAVASDQFQQWGYNVRAVLEIVMQGLRSIVPGAQSAGEAIGSMVEGIGNWIVGLINSASEWGAGFMEAFANGLASAINIVIGIIESLASIIADLMEPHSPPKFLPFIDKWGVETANLYVQGFSKASMDPINELSKQLEENLRNAFRFKGEFDLEDAIMNMRVGIVDAMHDIEQTGGITEETWNKIHDAMGPVGEDVDHIVNSYLDLAQAQEQVRQTTEALKNLQDEYNDAIRPVDREIDQLQTKLRIQRAQDDLNKAMENQAKGKDPGGVGVAEAQLKMQLLQAQIRKDQMKLAHQDELDAAEDAELAAKKRVDADKREIDSIKDKSTWMKDNIRIWDEFNKPPSGGGGGAKGGSGGILDNFTSGLESSRRRIEEEKNKISTAFEDMSNRLKPAITAWTSIHKSFEDIGNAIQHAREEVEKFYAAFDRKPPELPQMPTAADSQGADQYAGSGAKPPDLTPWEQFADAVKLKVAEINTFFQPFDDALRNMFNSLPGQANSVFSGVLEIIQWFSENGKAPMAEMMLNFKIIWDSFSGIVGAALTLVRDVIILFFDLVADDRKKFGDDWIKLWEDLGTNLRSIWDNIWKDITGTFDTFLADLKVKLDIAAGWFSVFSNIHIPGIPTGPTFGDKTPVSDAERAASGHAVGTDFWKGGLTLVGERGPELVDLPQATKIFSNDKSREMLNKSFGSRTVNHTPTFIINGGDPAEVERAIMRAERQTIQRLTDIFGSELEAV